MNRSEVTYRRDDLKQRLFFRSSRYFQVDKQWFFMTREKSSVGPYRSLFEAESYLEAFLGEATKTEELPLPTTSEKPQYEWDVDRHIEWLG